VDAQTCKLIVLDQTIQSMTEFKQNHRAWARASARGLQQALPSPSSIFKRATELFADPTSMASRSRIYRPKPDQSPVPPENPGRGSSTAANPRSLMTNRKESGKAVPVKQRLLMAATGKKFIVDDVPVTVFRRAGPVLRQGRQAGQRILA